MAFLDEERGVIVARVIYDGAPEAGKTTNVRRITESLSSTRRGELTSPGSIGPRTEYFDWVDFRGGYIQGYHLHCQILAVPGQFSLRNRRSYLLDTADVVVFVVDSGVESFDANSNAYEFLRHRIAKTSAGGLAMPFLVQANKQDLPGAMSPLELGKRLGTEGEVPVLGASAATGDGVMQTFLIAIRLAAERVQELLRTQAIAGISQTELSSDSLYAVLDRLEVLPEKIEDSSKVTVLVDALAAVEDESQSRPPPKALEVPAASTIVAGHLWPPVRGRSILAAINGADDIEFNPRLAAWAPRGSFEFHSANGWVLHTSDEWLFADEPAGRAQLMQCVRHCTAFPDWVPEGRVYMLAKDGDAWRFWMISKDTPTLHEMLERALREREVEELRGAFQVIQQALHTIVGISTEAWHRGLGELDWLAVAGDRLVCLAVPARGVGSDGESKGVGELVVQVQRLIRSASSRDPSLAARLLDALDGLPMGPAVLNGLESSAEASSHDPMQSGA